MNEITTTGYMPGALGRITELHARYYSREWGFGLFFEALVAAELAAFLQCYDDQRDGFWTLRQHGQVQGSIAIDGSRADTIGAHLRWFILADDLQGQGLGRPLLEQAIAFSRKCGHPRIVLSTFQGLKAARHLYESLGFRLTEEHRGQQWGATVLEQHFVLELG